ncbi:MAG: glycoside hydrolase family 97 protein [Bacteroidetes bacterium]|nr:MAG: glycoside hydrolase family 97 protein [Bacteroidota bacterium]TAG89977.1 MAG: glycoside hydrolase family 97 protein [Bacteroidota bacterium]
MKKIIITILFFGWIINTTKAQTLYKIQSPNKNLELIFELNQETQPIYQLNYKNKNVIKKSKLGIKMKNGNDFVDNFKLKSIQEKKFDETWQPAWGETKTIRNQYQNLVVNLENKNKQMIIIEFRLFDDGVGFRYEFPEQPNLQYFIISDEKTEFNLVGNHKTFWIPGDYDSNEYVYTTSKLSEIDAHKSKNATEIGVRTFFSANAVQTPLMMKTEDNLYINIHEAALVDYPAMNLMVDKQNFSLSSHLVPNALGDKAYLQTPAKTPWRTIIVSDKATEILASKTILNLNEPSKIKETAWIKPQKFVGVWWEMHVGKGTWNYSDTKNIKLKTTDFKTLKPNGKHAANNENTKRYIDFAAKNGFAGVLVEGWNVGWEDWFGNWKEEVFDFVTPYPDFDVKMLQNYAKSKGVKLIMHHETSGAVSNYERRLDEAFKFMKDNDYDAVKTGYVGKIIPRGEHHDGQIMVNHYVHVAEKAAQYQIMVDAHEPVRPTGLHRTYPNFMACEAARGNEFNAWSVGNPPEHETILPFTRLMGGPMDYTPGIFEIKMSHYNPNSTQQVHTTLAKQLALYITMYSPLQMVSDLPENYEKHLGAFQFIKDVPTDWDDTKIIEAEPADYITIARKEKNTENWFLGAITDENKRITNISLDFLNKNQVYVATIYQDGKDADWEKNPKAYQIQNILVKNTNTLKIGLANGGGCAVSFKLANKDDLKKLKFYK